MYQNESASEEKACLRIDAQRKRRKWHINSVGARGTNPISMKKKWKL